MSWGTELWDQFDSLDKHTQWGIDFLERYAKFVKERIEIEQNYAKQLSDLSRVLKISPVPHFFRVSKTEKIWLRSTVPNVLPKMKSQGQREVVAEEMAHRVYGELMRYAHDLKTERKMHLQEGRKAQQYLDMCWKQMDNSKKKFERECREAEKAQQSYERLDNDTNATKADVEKGPALEDFSHLPPEQRRKKLQQRIDELNRELQKESDQKEALNKMKDVYEKNPQMGDPGSLQPKLAETMNNIDRLRMEIHKNEAWLSEVEGKTGGRGDRRHSSDINHLVTQGRESPEGSYTDDANQEVRGPPQQHGHHSEFDDEFEDDDPLPAIGHCKAIYPFDGHNEGTLAMKEGEVLYIIEEDKGDGWTRARRQNGEEGYVPTSYIDVTLEKNSKGQPRRPEKEAEWPFLYRQQDQYEWGHREVFLVAAAQPVNLPLLLSVDQEFLPWTRVASDWKLKLKSKQRTGPSPQRA
ncbi:formin-binding protein 1-like isoform X9 [Hippopotamus amphibius kiboko]|uniref:formin-binding protein 1-like isoform X9 n=1 Tax=Hippopotamus amphibius kiboko TaxID=575201 RepID=UPI002594BA58|nr:formin-binding protein 1-like isoform X9 [Hippopotamus amphibius kiboko]